MKDHLDVLFAPVAMLAVSFTAPCQALADSDAPTLPMKVLGTRFSGGSVSLCGESAIIHAGVLHISSLSRVYFADQLRCRLTGRLVNNSDMSPMLLRFLRWKGRQHDSNGRKRRSCGLHHG
jgi:hypothetical protein